MPKRKRAATMVSTLSDRSQPRPQRRTMFRMAAQDDSPAAEEFFDTVFDILEAGNGEDLFAEKNEQLSRLMAEMMEGPLRPATFFSLVEPNGSGAYYASVLLDDGMWACTVVPDAGLATSLEAGDRVLLETKGSALLRRGPADPRVGDRATLERRLDGNRIEVIIRGDERAILLAPKWILDMIASGQTGPGDTLVVNPRLSLALDVLPPTDTLSHFQYLSRTPVPDVVAKRDMGNPPGVIAAIADYFRLEMLNPELRRRYRLKRSRMHLFSGVAGCGKTMSVHAVWRLMYEIMAEITGVAIEDLPPRVFTLRLSAILNSYLGQSDKNLERFFTEVEQLAAEPFVTPDGREVYLPVLAVMEEIDGLATQRGGDQNGIYDRILTTALQRLDPARPELRDKLILFIGTTNEIGNVDAAFLRRIGGEVEHFGRIGRRAFKAIIAKRIADLPVGGAGDGNEAAEIERRLGGELTDWLYSPNGSDPGVVELSFVGASASETKFRRDFLTGALVDRAVQVASDRAVASEAAGGPQGVTLDLLVTAFDAQVRNVAEQLNERNVHRYVDLPDAVRVATVRRIPQPVDGPLHLQAS